MPKITREGNTTLKAVAVEEDPWLGNGRREVQVEFKLILTFVECFWYTKSHLENGVDPEHKIQPLFSVRAIFQMYVQPAIACIKEKETETPKLPVISNLFRFVTFNLAQ